MFLATKTSLTTLKPLTTTSLALFSRRSLFLPQQQQQQQQQHFDQTTTTQSIDNRLYWTKQIHNLCFHHNNPDQALLLLNILRLRGYVPDSLNLSSIIHALCHLTRFHDAHCFFSHSLKQQHSHSHHSAADIDQRTCNVIIAKLLDSRDPHSTLRILSLLRDVKPEFVASLVNYNRLMDQLCLIRRRPGEAHRVLYEMLSRGHCPNTVSYTTLINGYCSIGELGHAQKVFDEMLETKNVSPNSMSYSVLIRGFLRKRDVRRVKELMEELWERMRGGNDETVVKNAAFSNLVDSLCKEGCFGEVFGIAKAMPQGLDEEYGYGQMIESLCKAGRHHGASRIVYIMRRRGFVPRVTSYNCIVHGLSKEGEGGCMRAYQLLEEGVSWFGYVPSEYTYKVLVEGLCRESDIDKARRVIECMLSKERVDKTRMYNIYLRALCLVDNTTELLNVLVSMLQIGCQPDVITLNIVVNGFCKNGRVEEALKVLDDMMNGKFCSPDVVTFTTIVNGLLNVGRTQEALGMLRCTMPEKGFKPNAVTYNAVLCGLFKRNRGREAMDIFNVMVSDNVTADSRTYTIIIDGLTESDQLEEAKRFWDDVIWPSKIHDDFVYSAIIKGICRSGNFDEACHFLYELVDSGVSPNIFSYNILIDTACKLGLKKEAYEVVREMRRNGLAPDSVTWRILDKLHGDARRQLCDEDSTLWSGK